MSLQAPGRSWVSVLRESNKPNNFAQLSEDGLNEASGGLKGNVPQKQWHPGQAKTERHWAKIFFFFFGLFRATPMAYGKFPS